MRKIKGFSYDPIGDKDIIAHIDKQHNRSQYIWELVRRDMKREDVEEVVKKYIEKYLGNIETSNNNKSESIEIEGVIDILNMQ